MAGCLMRTNSGDIMQLSLSAAGARANMSSAPAAVNRSYAASAGYTQELMLSDPGRGTGTCYRLRPQK